MRYLPYVVPVALAIYALFDVSRARVWELSGLPRWAWVLIIVLLPVVGPVAWLIVSRMRRAEAGGAPEPPTGGPGRPGGSLPRRRGPVAPDDDPDFLWRLEQEARRRRRGTGGADAPTEDAHGPAGEAQGPAEDAQDPAEDDPRA